MARGHYGELSLDTAYAYANATSSSPSNITAHVRNVGGKLVTSNAAYVNDSNVTSTDDSRYLPPML